MWDGVLQMAVLGAGCAVRVGVCVCTRVSGESCLTGCQPSGKWFAFFKDKHLPQGLCVPDQVVSNTLLEP